MHVRQAVGYALVAVDTGRFAGAQRLGVELSGAFALAGKVHELVVVAVAAFERIIGLQATPLALSHFPAHAEEFFASIDSPENLAPDLLGSLHLARDLVSPFMGHMTVGAGGAHAGAIGVVDGVLDFHVHVVFHLVAGNTEGFGVGRLQGGIEPAPEDDAGNEAAERQRTKAVMHAWPSQDDPVSLEKRQYRLHPGVLTLRSADVRDTAVRRCSRSRSAPAVSRRAALRGTGCRNSDVAQPYRASGCHDR